METRIVRTDEVRLQKEDQPYPNIRYYGRSDDVNASDSDPIWQIFRQVRTGGVVTTTYAQKGSFNCRWADRVSYFPAATATGEPVGYAPSIRISGLNIRGRVTTVLVNTNTWTALPPGGPLPYRNTLAIQNQSGVDLKINYDPATSGFNGIWLVSGGERVYDVTDNITVYAKSDIGPAYIVIEELS